MRIYLSPAAIDRMEPHELKSVAADLDGAIGEREAELAELRDLREQAERRMGVEPKFFIQSLRHAWGGDDAVWWRPNAAGYTREIAKAGEYDLATAEAHVRGCHGEDRVVPAELARRIAVRHVHAATLEQALCEGEASDAAA